MQRTIREMLKPKPVSQVETLETNGNGEEEGGNTVKTPSSSILQGGDSDSFEEKEKKKDEKRPVPRIYWVFTYYFKSLEMVETLETLLRHECDWYVFQEEICPTTGRPHLQGTLKLTHKRRMTEMQKFDPIIHWEPTISIKASLAYCTKAKTSTGKLWSYGIEVPEKLITHEPKGWQLEVMDWLNSPADDRTIRWICDLKGGRGKSCLAKYLYVHHNAIILAGKADNMYHMLTKFPQRRKIVIIDVPRSSLDYVNYQAIENIKNGLLMSGKYEGTMLAFNPPHIIVLANELPKIDKMSRDRWKIYDLSGIPPKLTEVTNHALSEH